MADIEKIPQEQIDHICGNAINDAKRFSIELKFDDESIAKLEMLLGRINEFIKQNNVPGEIVSKMAVTYGVYLGETMLRCYAAEHGYGWEVINGEPVLYKDDANKIMPVTQVHKRLSRDITENVYNFYNIGKDVVNGTFEKKVNEAE